MKRLVPRAGLEPALLAEPDFESGASTNFTTRALVGKTEMLAQGLGPFVPQRPAGAAVNR